MSKMIKVLVSVEIETPDKAEILRIKDDDGIVAEYIRVAGKLVKPGIFWSEYLSKDRMKEEIKELSGISGLGMGFVGLDDDFCEDNLKSYETENYYFEEIRNDKPNA